MIVGWVTSMRSLQYVRRLIDHIRRSFEQRFVEFTCQLRLECVGQIVFNRIGTTRSKRPVPTANVFGRLVRAASCQGALLAAYSLKIVVRLAAVSADKQIFASFPSAPTSTTSCRSFVVHVSRICVEARVDLMSAPK